MGTRAARAIPWIRGENRTATLVSAAQTQPHVTNVYKCNQKYSGWVRRGRERVSNKFLIVTCVSNGTRSWALQSSARRSAYSNAAELESNAVRLAKICVIGPLTSSTTNTSFAAQRSWMQYPALPPTHRRLNLVPP